MVTLAARTLGYHVVVLDPDPHCAAGAVADRVIAARFDDVDAAVALARACDVVTIEIEKIGIPSLEAAARIVPVRPGAHVLHMVQDRARQKDWLRGQGFRSARTGRCTPRRSSRPPPRTPAPMRS